MTDDIKKSVRQLKTDVTRMYRDPLNGIFSLYGEHQIGKSTTLGWLSFLLALC